MSGKSRYMEIDIAGNTPEEPKREKKGSCGGFFDGRCCGRHHGGTHEGDEAREAVEAAGYVGPDQAVENENLYRVVAQMYSQMLTLKGRTAYGRAKGPVKKH